MEYTLPIPGAVYQNNTTGKKVVFLCIHGNEAHFINGDLTSGTMDEVEFIDTHHSTGREADLDTILHAIWE